MESFITSYGLPFHDFQELLKKTGAVVAGSSALALYLQQEGIDAGFIPNDMDIFVHRPCPCDQCNPLVQFVRLHGFKKTGKFDCITIAAENARAYYSSMGDIRNVVSYMNDDGKEVQVISLRSDGDIKDYITDHFDLSICATWWDAEGFHTVDSELTKRKIMYRMNKPSDLDYLETKIQSRIEKYLLRGFRFDREVSAAEAVAVDYSKISAYDMMTLEDIPLSDFLLRSPSNIVIKVREQYYAFDRKTLVDYMVGKRVFVSDWVEIFETPYRQYLSSTNMSLLRSDVFRIYELCDESSVPFRGGMVSIYDVKAFTVKMWIEA
jgi:hypothetical protein